MSFTLPNLVARTTQKMNTQFDIDKIEQFLINHPNVGVAKTAFKEALETAKTNKRWMDTNAEPIKKWLQQSASPISSKFFFF